MGLARTTIAGMEIHFKKDGERNCTNCKYSYKKLFKKNKYECGIILGLNLDDGLDGFCWLYK